MPVSAGSLYDYYNPFAGTQRNLDRFTDLYERKKQRGLQEKGMGLEERRLNLAERGEGLESRYKEMMINTETEKLKMAQELRNDPATRISIMSKALKDAYTTGGKKMAENVLKTFQNNPNYQDDTKGYTIDDFQFTKAGGMYAPIITTEGERLEGQYGFIDPQGKMHELDMRTKGKKEPSPYYQYTKDVETPEGERKAEVFNTRTGEFEYREPAGKGQPKISPTIPAGSTEKLADFKTLIDLSKSVKDLWKPSYTGQIEGRIAKVKEKITGGLSDEQLNFNQSLASIANRLLYLRSGAQINESEFKRLMEELPSLNLPDDTARVRMEKFTKMVEDLYDNRLKGFESSGYRNVDKKQENLKPSLDDIFKGQ